MSVVYEDLYDIERRPGAGVALWTAAVERQLERVRDANYRHRLHHSPNEHERRADPEAESQLHTDVYFLALAIRRVLRFHDAFARQVDDARLQQARADFDALAPNASDLRNLYEHLDQYVLDDPRKHLKQVAGRAAPVLQSRWDCDNVVVKFGPLQMDVTLAGHAAVALGKTTTAVWEEHMARAKAALPRDEPPPDDDGIPRMLTVTLGTSTIIGGDDEALQRHTGRLLRVAVREATAHEVRRIWTSDTQPAVSAGDNPEPGP